MVQIGPSSLIKETDGKSVEIMDQQWRRFCDDGCYGENSLQCRDGLGNGKFGASDSDW
jgi:hypothetical protein